MDSLYIPKYAVLKPNYGSEFPENLNKDLKKLYKNTQSKLKKGFLEDPLDDDSDVYGVPDVHYDGLVKYVSEKSRFEILFYAKKIFKYYRFFYENEKLVIVTETFNDKKDSLFFYDDKIFLWKNTDNMYVIDSISLMGKSNYIIRLDREIKEIINSGVGVAAYIESDVHKNDSLSNFVVGNLKN